MRSSSLLALVLVVAPISAVHANDTHLRPYIVGSRAAGMGGAFTALSDDPSGGYYNPGGLAFSRRSSVSLSASVYGLTQRRYERVLADRSLESSDVQVFPVSTAGLVKFGKVKEGGIPEHTFAFGIFVPDAAEHLSEVELGSNEDVFLVNTETQSLWGGVGYAHRTGRLGLGVMLFAVHGTTNGYMDVSFYSPDSPNSFTTLNARTESKWFGGVAAAGVRWTPDDSWSLGVSLFSPALGFGSRNVYTRINAGQDSGTADGLPIQSVAAEEGLDRGPTVPLRAQMGVACSFSRLVVAADAILLAPVTKTFDEGTAFESRLDRPGILNVSLGGEFLLTPAWPIRAGFFTDFSAARDPDDVAGTPDEPSNTHDVDMFGATFSVGHRSEHVVTDVGINASFGKGKAALPVDLELTRTRAVDSSQRLLYVFLATTYEF